MNFIERYKDYKRNKFIMRMFLDAQLIFVGFYIYAILFLESIESYSFIMSVMLCLPIIFNICIDKKRSNKSSLMKRNGKEMSVKALIKYRVKVRREINKTSYIKLERFYSLFFSIMVVILPVLTVLFAKKHVELNPNSTVYIPVIALVLNIIGQIIFLSVSLKNSKDLLEKLKDKGELEDKIVLEKDDEVIETSSIKKINSLIKRGYEYNKGNLKKLLME